MGPFDCPRAHGRSKDRLPSETRPSDAFKGLCLAAPPTRALGVDRMLRRASPFQLLILDCDGVVVDSEPIVMRILVEMLHELGVSIEAEEANERFIGTTFARTLELDVCHD